MYVEYLPKISYSYSKTNHMIVLKFFYNKDFNFELAFSGGRRFSEGTSADREIQRTLMEV